MLSLVSDSFTDTAISSNRVNGEHKEKVLQRWEGGDSNGENYDLDNDAVSRYVYHTQKDTETLISIQFDYISIFWMTLKAGFLFKIVFLISIIVHCWVFLFVLFSPMAGMPTRCFATMK